MHHPQRSSFFSFSHFLSLLLLIAVSGLFISAIHPPKPATLFELKWGELTCDCTQDQFPRFFKCENQSLTPKQFRKLLKQGEGFTLWKDDQKIAWRDLELMSKRMRDLGGYQGQFDFQKEFNSNSVFWEDLEKGDVLKFTFRANEKDYFQFDLTINTRKDKFDYAYDFQFGKQCIPVDMTNSAGVRIIDYPSFQKLIHKPVQLLRNGEEVQTIRSLRVGNSKAMLITEMDDLGQTELQFDQFAPFKEAMPGDRINLKLETTRDVELRLDFQIRKNPVVPGLKREVSLKWGDFQMESEEGFMFDLSLERIHRLADEPFEIMLNGEELGIKTIRNVHNYNTKAGSHENYTQCEVDDYQRSFNCLSKMFRKAEKGDMISLLGISTESGHQLNMVITVEKDKSGF